MSIYLVTVSSSPGALDEVDASLDDLGARLMRIWETPPAVTAPSNWIVAGGLHAPVAAYEALARPDLHVHGIRPMRLGDATAPTLETLDAILPRSLTTEDAVRLQAQTSPTFELPDASIGPGVIVWPCCGGVGGHLNSCPYARARSK
jgi:hypothetical protein